MSIKKNKNKSLEASYYLQRVEMLRELKPYREILEGISVNGIRDAEEERLAKIACSIIASDYHYEDSIMGNKTGGDYTPLIIPPD